MSLYALLVLTTIIFMMYCKKIMNNDKCGKCKYNILYSNFVRDKSLVKIARIAVNISWIDRFSDNNDTTSTINSADITCTGTIVINRLNKDNKALDISIAKYICKALFDNWYTYYPLSANLESYKYIQGKLQDISEAVSVVKIRTLLLSITKYIESTTICQGNCTTVVPGKEVSNCIFSLSDINKIVKFSSEGIVDILNTILFAVKDLAGVNLTIDLNSTYVTCAGNVIMDKNFIKCKSTIADMKSTYTYYLSAWCSANISKQSEIYKIKSNINNVRKAKYISDIYELSSDLLGII